MERLELGTPYSMLEGTNSVYVLQSDDAVTLVDTGFGSDDVRAQFEAALADRDLAMADVDQVVCTHWHPDHSGLIGDIHDAGGADSYLHEAEWDLLSSGNEQVGATTDEETAIEEWGVPEDERDIFRDSVGAGQMAATVDIGDIAEPMCFGGGETITVADRELEVLHTPGHTLGSVVYLFEGSAGTEAFTGDTLLPSYTPNVGTDPRLDESLAAYLDSLERLAGRLDRAWPGHRAVIDDPDERIREIVAHHEERCEAVLELLADEAPAEVWGLADALFGELEGFHVVLAAVETHAHLEYLEREGVVERTPAGYRPLVDAGTSLSGAFPEV